MTIYTCKYVLIGAVHALMNNYYDYQLLSLGIIEILAILLILTESLVKVNSFELMSFELVSFESLKTH